MKTLRKHWDTVLFIVGLVFVLGLVTEIPPEHLSTTAVVEQTMSQAKDEELARHRPEDWHHHMEWAEQFVPKAPQIALY